MFDIKCYNLFIVFLKVVNKITVKFITLGCKTNIYESEAMAAMFKEAGYEVVSSDPADVCVINTCTVTGIGAKKSRSQIRKAKKLNPNAVIAVTGCFAQTEPEAVRQIGADVIIGNKGRDRIVELVGEALNGRKTDMVGNILSVSEYEDLPATHHQSRIRANVKIEDGCGNFCSYCIIPFARGPVRSRSLEKIIEEANALTSSGYKEIVLTGIHIGSYGKDLNNGTGLIDVIEALDMAGGLPRVRLGSIEPVLITEDFVGRIKNIGNLCPQFHLSLQSGCTETLKRMNRRYTAEEFRRSVDLLRDNIPDASITTDLMVGFPGESEHEFEQSYEFCRSIGFMQMHIFKYSVRQGTVAEKLRPQIPEAVKHERSQKMLELSEDMKRSFYEKYIGKELTVLTEQTSGEGLHATSANYMDVIIRPGDGIAPGQFIKVMPEGYENGFLYGTASDF